MTSSSLWKTLFLTVLAFTALACITINVYFPEAVVKDLSEKIEDAVVKEAAKHANDAGVTDAGATDAEDGAGEGPETADLQAADANMLAEARSRSAIELVVTAVYDMTAAPIAAQDVAAPEISNPAIRKIIESRSKRVASIDGHKAKGVLGENNQALLEIRELGALPLQQRAAVQKLVRDENADRERMFREIAAATSVDLSQLSRIQTTYAETLRQKAAKGHWVQGADGQWRQK